MLPHQKKEREKERREGKTEGKTEGRDRGRRKGGRWLTGKDPFSRKLKVRIAKESNFLTQQRLWVWNQHPLSLQSAPLLSDFQMTFKLKSYFVKGIRLKKQNKAKLMSRPITSSWSTRVVTNGGTSFCRLEDILLFVHANGQDVERAQKRTNQGKCLRMFRGTTETQKFCRKWVVTGTWREGRDFIVGQTWVLAPVPSFLQDSKLRTPASPGENVAFRSGYLSQSQCSVPVTRWTWARNDLQLTAVGESRRTVQPSKDVSSKHIQSLARHPSSSESCGGWTSRLATTPSQESPRTIHLAAPACSVDWWDRWHHWTEWHLLSLNIISKLFIHSRKKKKSM